MRGLSDYRKGRERRRPPRAGGAGHPGIERPGARSRWRGGRRRGRTARAAVPVVLGTLLPLLPSSAALAQDPAAQATAAQAPGAASPTPASADASAVTVVSSARLGPRLREYTLRTPLLPEPTGVRVLLPEGYASGDRRYPVLYLLHGSGNTYRSWTEDGDAEALTDGYPFIVVMPDGGQGASYTDWSGPALDGARPRWEEYHTGALVAWVDSAFRTVADRRGRAVAGLSNGGFGAASYAARHPDGYLSAAAFSAPVNSNDDLWVSWVRALRDRGLPSALWGPRPTQEVVWRAHNPWDLAVNYGSTDLTLMTGNGTPGPLDSVLDTPSPLEYLAWKEMSSLHGRLDEAGVAHRWTDYGPGLHEWRYWRRDLRDYLPRLSALFAAPPPVPSSFAFTAAGARYDVHGWTVEIARPEAEFSLLRADGEGFALEGSGAAKVSPPDRYTPGEARQVAVSDAAGTRTVTVRAGADGRITVGLDLGPGNTCRQYTAGCVTAVRHGTASFG